MLRGFSIIAFFILIISVLVPAQMRGKMRSIQKMEELKKIKLIEILQMDETTSIKFFTRRSEHIKLMEGLSETSREKIGQIEEVIKSQDDNDDPQLKKTLNEYFQLQDNLLKERQNFFQSVSDILTIEQMAKLVVFEERFRDEVSGLLFRQRNKQLRDK